MSLNPNATPAPKDEAPAKTYSVKRWVDTVNRSCGKTAAGDARFARNAVVTDANGVDHTVEVLGTADVWENLDASRVQMMGRDVRQFWACSAPHGAVPQSFAL